MAETNPYWTGCAGTRRSRRCGGAAVLAAALLGLCTAGAASAFDSERADFSVHVHGVTIPYRVFAVYAMPGEKLDITVASGPPSSTYRLRAGGRTFPSAESGHWRWPVPATPGIERLSIDDGRDTIRLNVVVMHPAAEIRDGRLHAYRIGHYPAAALRGEAIYRPPRGFIELDRQDAALRLSPHFRLDQFPAKEAGGPPKYLVLRERLVLKLELLLDRLNALGRHAETLTIMSGYRTPSYNAALGNVEYSRHLYGGAADIYVDSSPRNGIMDDLNRDGVSDYRDAQWLYRLAAKLFSAGGPYAYLAGGLGVYRSTRYHGPFVHIDARGSRTRWGLIPPVQAHASLKRTGSAQGKTGGGA